MDYIIKNGGVLLKQPDFDLDETLDCGQAFRWVRLPDGGYTGARLDTPLTIRPAAEKGVFFLEDTTEEQFLNVWCGYFDLNTDYGELKRRFSEDGTLSKACAFAGGIRILRQDAWEALSSFIISQNNNIPRIKGIIGRLCQHYGSYPTAEQLSGETAESLSFLRAGFRAKYIVDAVARVRGGLDLDEVSLLPTDDARAHLMQIKGVGPKVADCAMLFGMYKLDAFPKDVWVKRVLAEWYPGGLPECVRGAEGIAQQYLFHYIRNIDQN